MRDSLGRNRSHADRGDRAPREPSVKRAQAVVAADGANGAMDTLGVLMHLSHEIRTPLNSMLVLSQLLRDGLAGQLNPEQQNYIEVIERNGQNLIRLVNDVLDLSRMEAGHVAPEMRSLDIGDQLRAITAALSPLALAKNITLSLDTSRELPPVRCDPERVRQVLTNLVGNAIKFTDRGAVTLSAEPRDAMVAVHVVDTGVGIPAAARPRLFEEFFQAASLTPEGRREGTGLGLTIASRLVRLMGGELSVTSTEGVGSCFTFTLPRAQRQPHRTDNIDDQAGASSGEPATSGRAPVVPRFQDEPYGTNTPG